LAGSRRRGTVTRCDVAIVGGGVVGTAALYALSRYTNIPKIILIEKHPDVASVQSSRDSNSQTLHFGDIETNYSLKKARSVNAGAEMLAAYLDRRGRGTFRKFPKMVLAVGKKEVEFLERRYREFKKVFPKMRLIRRDEIARIEPNVVKGRRAGEELAAILSPDGYAVDYGALSRSFVRESRRSGKRVAVLTDKKVLKIERDGDRYKVKFKGGHVEASAVIVAASGYSMKFAHMMGYGREYIILPVSGTFFLAPKVLNGKVYTVQHPKLPFAAVHGDPSLGNSGETRFGPTARVLPILEPRKYRSFFDFMGLFRFRVDGFHSLARIMYDGVIFRFVMRNVLMDVPFVGKHVFARDVRKIVPAMRTRHLRHGRVGGIRPQLVDTRTKSLFLGEAKIVGDGIIFDISPSPGASMCLRNAQESAEKVVQFLGGKYRFDRARFLSDGRRRK